MGRRTLKIFVLQCNPFNQTTFKQVTGVVKFPLGFLAFTGKEFGVELTSVVLIFLLLYLYVNVLFCLYKVKIEMNSITV